MKGSIDKFLDQIADDLHDERQTVLPVLKLQTKRVFAILQEHLSRRCCHALSEAYEKDGGRGERGKAKALCAILLPFYRMVFKQASECPEMQAGCIATCHAMCPRTRQCNPRVQGGEPWSQINRARWY